MLSSCIYSRSICCSDYSKSGVSDFFSISEAQKDFKDIFQKSRNLLKNRGRKAIARGTCGGTRCQSQAEIRFFICLPGRASALPDFSNTWRGLSGTYTSKESSKSDKSSKNKCWVEGAPALCPRLIVMCEMYLGQDEKEPL